jgi:hypothetical protein
VKQAAFPAVVIAVAIALIAFAIWNGGGDDTSTTTPGVTRAQTPTVAREVIFVAPRDGATVSNPIDVRMAVSGVLLQPATSPAASGQGHLYLILDGEAPAAGTKLSGHPPARLPPDIDLTDASHETTLPSLSPGRHTLTLLFVDSDDVFTDAALMATVTVTVAG